MKKILLVLLVISLMTLPAFVFAEDTVEVGDMKMDAMPAWAVGNETAISAKIIAEYQNQADDGFDLGTPQDEVQGWNDAVVRQFFKFGDNTGSPWGWGATGAVGFIMYREGDNAYTLKNEMLDAWSALGHFDSVGYPTSNKFEEGGKIYQNFSMGYIVCDVDDSTSAELMTGTITPTPEEDDESESPSTGDIGVMIPMVIGLLSISGVAAIRKKK